MNRVIILFFLFCFMPSMANAEKKGENLKALLSDIDKALDCVSEYDRPKEERLADLKHRLALAASSDEKNDIYNRLFKEYEPYTFDSAMYYAKAHLDIAVREKNTYWINECRMRLARMYSTFARFTEAIDMLNSIDKRELIQEQLLAYYNAYIEIYTYWIEDSNQDEMENLLSMKNEYQSLALALDLQGYRYDIIYGRKSIESKDFSGAEKTLLPYLSLINPDTRDYAILTSTIAYLYELKGKEELQKEFLARSALADIKGSVKENTSLRTLAYYLLNDGDINHANRYIKKSLEDANFFNARLRNVQITKILPVIDKSYQLEKEAYQRNLLIAVMVIGILTLILIGIVYYLFHQMKKLSRTRQALIRTNASLTKTNIRLSETNRIKEEYIGHFLSRCSAYIDKLNAYRKSLNKTASKGKIEELMEMLKSSQIIENELKEFYQNFDDTFLSLFPDFVEEFNKLLPEDEQVIPKHKSELTIELRIFALMRLGITDSAKIAGFLRYSITTIYNYRSKYRNKSLIARDKFEETVMKIGQINQ